MTVYTCAAYTTAADICDGGKERTEALLQRLGLGLNDWASMQLIMRELGLSDTLFSFCKVKKGCEKEAQKVLRAFITHCVGRASSFIGLTRMDLASQLVNANKAINKRMAGIHRPAYLLQEYKAVSRLHVNEFEPHVKFWLDVYRCALSDKPEHLIATHAGIAMMDGAAVLNFRPQMHKALCDKLNELLGPE